MRRISIWDDRVLVVCFVRKYFAFLGSVAVTRVSRSTVHSYRIAGARRLHWQYSNTVVSIRIIALIWKERILIAGIHSKRGIDCVLLLITIAPANLGYIVTGPLEQEDGRAALVVVLFSIRIIALGVRVPISNCRDLIGVTSVLVNYCKLPMLP